MCSLLFQPVIFESGSRWLESAGRWREVTVSFQWLFVICVWNVRHTHDVWCYRISSSLYRVSRSSHWTIVMTDQWIANMIDGDECGDENSEDLNWVHITSDHSQPRDLVRRSDSWLLLQMWTVMDDLSAALPSLCRYIFRVNCNEVKLG